MFYYTYFSEALIWLTCGIVIGFVFTKSASEKMFKTILLCAALLCIGAFIGGYYAWFAGAKAQLGQSLLH